MERSRAGGWDPGSLLGIPGQGLGTGGSSDANPSPGSLVKSRLLQGSGTSQEEELKLLEVASVSAHDDIAITVPLAPHPRSVSWGDFSIRPS